MVALTSEDRDSSNSGKRNLTNFRVSLSIPSFIKSYQVLIDLSIYILSLFVMKQWKHLNCEVSLKFTLHILKVKLSKGLISIVFSSLAIDL